MQPYELEKWIWTEKDFDAMGWHDATVYGLQLEQNLALDIDYIFQWNPPEIEGLPFTFWIAPCTLIFERLTDLSFELTGTFNATYLEIADIERVTTGQTTRWTIDTHQGAIMFNADSFKQIVRRQPCFQFGQTIPYDERGGFSFDTTPGDQIASELKPHIEKRNAEDWEHYEMAKKRHVLRKELETLSAERESGEIQTNDYLVQKKELKEKLDSLSFYLKSTRFEGW